MFGEGITGFGRIDALKEAREERFLMLLKRWPATGTLKKCQMKGLMLHRVEEGYRRIEMFTAFLPCNYFNDHVEQDVIFIDGTPDVSVMVEWFPTMHCCQVV